MHLYTKLSLVTFGTFLSSVFVLNNCKRLEGYQFPVYLTSFCPKDEIQWNKRSSAINCTSSNGYLCLPNENFTKLLEFCYTEPKIWIPKGYCLYLVKHASKVNTYSCRHFKYGCHNFSYLSTRIFENPACISIGYGCFLAEPSCERTPTPINLSNTKDEWVWIVALVCAFSFIFTVFSIPFIKRFCHKKADDFSNEFHHEYDEIDSNIDESEDDEMDPTSKDKLLVKANIRKENLPANMENVCMEYGGNVFSFDSSNGYENPVQRSNGSDINLCKNNKVSLPTLSICQDEYGNVQRLLSNEADVNFSLKEGTGHSFKSCQNKHESTVQQLLNNAAEINVHVDDGINQLYIACENGDYDFARLLLSKGANIDLCLGDGSSPLCVICYDGLDNIAQLLLENKANVNLCLKNGASPLYIACQNGHDIIVQSLVSNGADVNLCMKDRSSPLYIACQNEHNSIVNLLLKKGADVNTCMEDGASPLYIACLNGHNSTVQLLLEKGADVNLCMIDGSSPLVIACHN